MKQIPKERRDAILAKLSGPDRKSVAELAKAEGVSRATLYLWRKQARLSGELMPDHDDTPEGWSAQDKFNAVLQTAAMSESQTSEYCRKQGLYPEQIQLWKKACQSANDWDSSQRAKISKQQRSDQKKIKILERDLQRKEKALAEAAALLILQKKVRAIWEDEDA